MSISNHIHILRIAFFLGLLSIPSVIHSQGSDFGIWTEMAAEKKINRRWSAGVEAEVRTNDDASQTSRWAIGLYGQYKIAKWLKAGGGYDFLYDRRQQYTYHADGSLNKYANYWTPRHRFHLDLTGQVNFGFWKLSLRERWQYTYRPQKTIAGRYDYDEGAYDDERKTYSGRGKNVLRSRLKVVYDWRMVRLEPYASIELYNALNIEKERYTLGLDWNVNKHNILGAFYRYQNVVDDDDMGLHVLGINYKYKF